MLVNISKRKTTRQSQGSQCSSAAVFLKNNRYDVLQPIHRNSTVNRTQHFVDSIIKTQCLWNPRTHAQFLEEEESRLQLKEREQSVEMCFAWLQTQHRPEHHLWGFSILLSVALLTQNAWVSVLITKERNQQTSQPVNPHSRPFQKKKDTREKT